MLCGWGWVNSQCITQWGQPLSKCELITLCPVSSPVFLLDWRCLPPSTHTVLPTSHLNILRPSLFISSFQSFLMFIMPYPSGSQNEHRYYCGNQFPALQRPYGLFIKTFLPEKEPVVQVSFWFYVPISPFTGTLLSPKRMKAHLFSIRTQYSCGLNTLWGKKDKINLK